MSTNTLLIKLSEDLRSLASSIDAVARAGVEEKPAEITLEAVRAVLAEKAQAGHTTEVRALLKKYGAPRLSEIDQAHYPALLADAEGLQ